MGVGSLSEGCIHCQSWEDLRKDSGPLKTLRHVTSFCVWGRGGRGGGGESAQQYCGLRSRQLQARWVTPSGLLPCKPGDFPVYFVFSPPCSFNCHPTAGAGRCLRKE